MHGCWRLRQSDNKLIGEHGIELLEGARKISDKFSALYVYELPWTLYEIEITGKYICVIVPGLNKT